MLTFVGFLYLYLFLGTCVLDQKHFFLFTVFLVIVGDNDMYSQWLVPDVLFVYVFYAYCKSISQSVMVYGSEI